MPRRPAEGGLWDGLGRLVQSVQDASASIVRSDTTAIAACLLAVVAIPIGFALGYVVGAPAAEPRTGLSFWINAVTFGISYLIPVPIIGAAADHLLGGRGRMWTFTRLAALMWPIASLVLVDSVFERVQET